MKSAKLVLVLMSTMVLCLSLVVVAQQDQPAPRPQSDPDMGAVHQDLLNPEDRAEDANRLTEAVAAALPDVTPSGPIARKNFVDEFIFGRMERENIPHAPLSSDEEFLRRAYLDATGLLPEADKVRSFKSDTDPDKRDQLIDELIGSEPFLDQWAYHWGELMRAGGDFHLWTKEWLRVDRPYDEVFYDIVTPTARNAGTFPTSAAFYNPISYLSTRCGFWMDSDDYKGFNRLDFIDEVTTDIGRVFMGLQVECISCHNGAGHADSFNLWLGSKRRTDFWRQSAFFGDMRVVGYTRGAANTWGRAAIWDDTAVGYNTAIDGYYTPAENRFPRDGNTYEPSFLLTGEKPKPGETSREALGRILPTHFQFSRAAVNLVWQKLMVIGLVEPYSGFDLMRVDPNIPPPEGWDYQPSNPELLQALAEDFRDNNFSIHRVIKTIMKSNAYQLSTSFPGEWTEAYVPYHARRFARTFTPVEAIDVVAQATASGLGLRQFGESLSYMKEMNSPTRGGGDIAPFLAAYYQSDRRLAPQNVNVSSAVQAMMMMSSPIVNDRVVAEGTTRVATLIEAGSSDDEIIEELFLASLSRWPTPEEVTVAKRLLAEDTRTGAEDIQWALLNSVEFVVNH
jgi:hypothetical protein